VAAAIRLQSQQQYTRSNNDIDTALLTSITRTIRAESQKGETSADVPTTEEKKRVRTRKGKEDPDTGTTNGHGSLHSMELLAQQKKTQNKEEGSQQSTLDEPEETTEQ
jgi:hypothetical protein